MEVEPHEDGVFYDSLGMKLWEKRHFQVNTILESKNITRVCDLGCNDGKFIRRLTRDDKFEMIIGVDIDPKALSNAEKNSSPEGYHLIMNPEKDDPLKVMLFEANLLKDCSFLKKYNIEAITLIEVIEHINMEDLVYLNINVFGLLSPKLVIITTPNYEFNRFFTDVSQYTDNYRIFKIKRPSFRHLDHKFEMTRDEFAKWTYSVAEEFGYSVLIDGVGLPKTNDISRGFASQIAIFEKQENILTSTKKYSLHPQTEKLVAEITYPARKKRTIEENFIAELYYSYSFVKSYNTSDGDSWETDEELGIDQLHSFEFLAIKDLIKMRNLNKLTSGDPKIFLELLEKSVDKSKYELSSNKRGIRLIEEDDSESSNSF